MHITCSFNERYINLLVCFQSFLLASNHQFILQLFFWDKLLLNQINTESLKRNYTVSYIFFQISFWVFFFSKAGIWLDLSRWHHLHEFLSQIVMEFLWSILLYFEFLYTVSKIENWQHKRVWFWLSKTCGKEQNVAGRAKDGGRTIQTWNRKSFKCLQFSLHTVRGLILKKIIY